jgi:GNAT superfamily N-acetyltransferase
MATARDETSRGMLVMRSREGHPGLSRTMFRDSRTAGMPRLSLHCRAAAGVSRWMTSARWSISVDPSLLQLDIVFPWLHGCYWSPGIRRDVVERAFAGSLMAGAYLDGVQVGVARVVTDQATFAWLCDVYVAEAVRGQGIARAMVQTLIDDPRLQTLRRWCLGTRDAHEVYRPLGFGPVDPRIWMQYLPDPERWT